MTRQQLQAMIDAIAYQTDQKASGPQNYLDPGLTPGARFDQTTGPAPVSGGDYADIFATQLANQNRAGIARQRTTNDLLFGRHLGIGGGDITPTNPTGDPRDPFNNPAYFAGNPTNRAAQAIQASPLWQIGPGGRLIHGTNYPIAPGVVGLPATGGSPADTLPPMSPAEQDLTAQRYAPPPPDVFAERGLPTTGETLPNQLVQRRQPYVPPPPPRDIASY